MVAVLLDVAVLSHSQGLRNEYQGSSKWYRSLAWGPSASNCTPRLHPSLGPRAAVAQWLEQAGLR